MTHRVPETPVSPQIEELMVAAHPTTGTDDDEHADDLGNREGDATER